MMLDPRFGRPRLVLVDDDTTFCSVLAQALERRGYAVAVAHDGASGTALIDELMPPYAVLDLRLPDMSGLRLVSRLKSADAGTRILVLTGYGSIATAIDAIKLGATYYLTKPANADDVVAAFDSRTPNLEASGEPEPETETALVSLNRLEWEHIQRVLTQVGGNISAAARALDMHRRTLQRKLSKNPPRR